ncbi:MAG: hypothetical protein IPM53_29920 [Anaerolineaceae bacterium]|nr:hypothetical protein [Anaerolineaceae bacterium]
MKLIKPSTSRALTNIRDQALVSSRNTSTGALLFELYALFNSLEEIDPEGIKETIITENRLHKNSYEMRCKVGKQARYIELPSIALDHREY